MFLRRFLGIRAVQKVICDPAQLSGRGFSRNVYMKLCSSQFYIFWTHILCQNFETIRLYIRIFDFLNFISHHFHPYSTPSVPQRNSARYGVLASSRFFFSTSIAQKYIQKNIYTCICMCFEEALLF